MFYARSGQIKVDGNNPQGQGIKKRFQSALVFQARFHVTLEQFSDVLFNRARKCGYAEIMQNMGFYMFFACRLFLERVGSHKQRSAQISLKNIGKKAFNT